MGLESIIGWVEAHPTTVEMLKWVLLVLVAWAAGVFRFFRRYTLRSKLKIIGGASRCLLQEVGEYKGCKDVERVGYLLSVQVTNPTNETVVVETFSMSYMQKKYLWARSIEHHPITLPNLPRVVIGDGVKLSKVFFSYYPHDGEKLTMDGILPPKQFQNAYVFFISCTYGSWNPRTIDNKIPVRIKAKLTSGEVLQASARVTITKDEKMFEEWIPGIIEHMEKEQTWNAEAE